MSRAPKTAAASRTSGRLDRLDALRGLAMVWMTAFHFCFDLSYLGIWAQDFYRDPFWVWQRTAIVSLFLFCAGLAQAVALAQNVPWGHFLRRWGVVAACALAVSMGSYLMFPQSYIYFGVLHGMAAMLLMVRAWRGVPAWLLLVVAVIAIALPPVYRHTAGSLPPEWMQWLNGRAGSVLGLITTKPRTEDYVPLLPWLGIMLLGFVAGRQWFAQASGSARTWWSRPARAGAMRLLAWLGRHSLPYYMLHQLVLLGGLMLVMQVLQLRH
ncbi:heparan-alpha-glucosaminide N-acetyltransferase [Comamonas testosteroni]